MVLRCSGRGLLRLHHGKQEKRHPVHWGANDLVRRVYEHKHGLVEGFTKRHGVKLLVYFEAHDRAEQAIQREKTLKHWIRDWKISLIERNNPNWDDLYDGLCR